MIGRYIGRDIAGIKSIDEFIQLYAEALFVAEFERDMMAAAIVKALGGDKES